MPVPSELDLKDHCTFIAKYLSLVIPMLKQGETANSVRKVMCLIVKQLDTAFQEATGFNTMGRDSGQAQGYFPDRDLVFKYPINADWLPLANKLSTVIHCNMGDLLSLSDYEEEAPAAVIVSQQSTKNSFFSQGETIRNPSASDIRVSARTFLERAKEILQLIGPDGLLNEDDQLLLEQEEGSVAIALA